MLREKKMEAPTGNWTRACQVTGRHATIELWKPCCEEELVLSYRFSFGCFIYFSIQPCQPSVYGSCTGGRDWMKIRNANKVWLKWKVFQFHCNLTLQGGIEPKSRNANPTLWPPSDWKFTPLVPCGHLWMNLKFTHLGPAGPRGWI